ncbi:MAG TPA: DUF2807 domain-containing protein [Acetobacteraceae bacterium]|nr:DUF2807 domain-containing protein [Acetobacteraceae bacterium]
MARMARRAAMFAAGSVIAGAACSARADSVTITTNGSSSTIIINGHVVSGGSGTTVAKGPIETERRALPGYSGIQLDAPADLTFSPSDKTGVAVTAPADVLKLIRTEVEGGTLVIALNGSVVLSSPIEIAASGPNLTGIALTGAGTVKAAGLSGPDLNISLSGSGGVTADGHVTQVGIRVSGSGDVDVAAIPAASVSGVITGSGTIRAFASERIKATITGSGTFIVSGNPTQRETNVIGSGDILFR